jgi:benzoyl-CoA reductase/2-hydroxyglutaryl-CoA dehydratase subunit BcrC/BadD/HgdB
MDLEPVVMWGLGPYFPRTSKSDHHLQSFVCSVGRHLTEFVLSRAGTLLDGIFMYNACDTLRNLPEILRCALEEQDRHLPILNIHIPMVPRRQTDASQYLGNEMNALIERLESTFGTPFSENRFSESIALYNKSRKLAQQLERVVADGRMGFKEFAGLILGNYFRSLYEQIDMLEASLKKTEKALPISGKAQSDGRIIVSGILPPHDSICSAIDESGLRVVGNDIASLARSYSYTPETAASPAHYYTDFYVRHHPCTTLLGSGDDRIAALDALIEERDARGVIFLGEKFCEYEFFEFPYLEKHLQDKGLHTLLLEFAIEDRNLGALKTRIDAFSELMA